MMRDHSDSPEPPDWALLFLGLAATRQRNIKNKIQYQRLQEMMQLTTFMALYTRVAYFPNKAHLPLAFSSFAQQKYRQLWLQHLTWSCSRKYAKERGEKRTGGCAMQSSTAVAPYHCNNQAILLLHKHYRYLNTSLGSPQAAQHATAYPI